MDLSSVNVLAVASAVGLFPLTRVLLVARELRARGATVTIAYRWPEEPWLRAEGFQTVPVAGITATDFERALFTGYDSRQIEASIQDELDAIDIVQPDFILSDTRLTAPIAARLAGVPLVTIVNGGLTRYYNPVAGVKGRVDRSAIPSVAAISTRAVQEREALSVVAHFADIARACQLDGLDTLYDFLSGDLTLLADLPHFLPLSYLPSNVRYIGPLIWEGPPEAVRLSGQEMFQRVIYATAGNTGNRQLIDHVIEAFGEIPGYFVVLTTGAFIDPARIPCPSNFQIERFFPGSQILPRAQAVIHTAGSATTYQALRYGTPALAVPFTDEQQVYAQLIAKHQAGAWCSPATLTGPRLREQLGQILETPALRANTRRFEQIMRGTDGPGAAVDEIESFLADARSSPRSVLDRR